MVMDSTTVDIQLMQESGEIESFDYETEYNEDYADLKNPEEEVGEDNYSVTCRRIPLKEGDNFGYQLRMLYMDYTQGDLGEGDLGHPEDYRLYLGNRGPISTHITMTAPPQLLSPGENQMPSSAGQFRCSKVLGAMNYTLQLSTDSQFSPTKTKSITANIEGEQSVSASFTLDQLWATFPPQGDTGQPIYWRMGAKVAGFPLPVAQYDHNQDGWVFSAKRVFLLTSVPPAGTLRFRPGVNGIPGKTNNFGREGRSRLFR